MYNRTITTGTTTSTTCQVTMVMIIMVPATSIVPEMTKLIVYGMSKSKMLRSDEACTVKNIVSNYLHFLKCEQVIIDIFGIVYPGHDPSSWSGIEEQHWGPEQ